MDQKVLPIQKQNKNIYMEDVPQGIRVNPEDQVQLQAHHPLQTTSKDDYTALLSSSFATP